MGWIRFYKNWEHMKSLTPFDTCAKAELYRQDAHRYCSKWVCAEERPELWPKERIMKACVGCQFFKKETPYAVDNGDGTGSLKGKLVGMGF